MRWLRGAVLLTTAFYFGGGVTQPSDVSKFWTDDYKVFEQVYGKTSDREIYGATLPPSISYGIDLTKLKVSEAIDKKEKYIENEDLNTDTDLQIPSYAYGDKYGEFLAKQLKADKEIKPTKPSLKFISYSDFKPISQTTDPETYKYLKNLEKLRKQEIDFPQEVEGGFKPYLSDVGAKPYLNDASIKTYLSEAAIKSYLKDAVAKPYVTDLGSKTEESDAYKSIQDILDAHEANKGKKKPKNDNRGKYPNGGGKRNKKANVRFVGNDIGSRCPSGRCRKRATNTVRVRTRPYLRKIKHRIISY